MLAYEEDTAQTTTPGTAPGPAETAQPVPATSGAASAAATPLILLVDDEAGVLASLRRLLRPTGYRVITAESGAAGLEMLAVYPVDLIVSDMRMPGMSGAEFLACARERYPDVMRILLTGYSEIDSAVRAINEGGVYRYLNKPWDDQDLLLTVRHAVEQRTLAREAQRLSDLTRQQNDMLQRLNAGLETQVQARTEEIRQTVMFLEGAQRDLKTSFTNMVQVCASMIEMRCGAMARQSLRVADLARRIAIGCGLTGLQVQDIFHAGLLHGIGKLSLPDVLLSTSLDRLSAEQAQQFYQHPLRAQMVLTPVPQLEQVAQIIRHQYERFNGRGTPDRLAGPAIPIGARIVAVARDFEGLMSGEIVKQRTSPDQAMEMIKAQSGLRYDPDVVVRFVAVLKQQGEVMPVRQITSTELREGMRLADDLLTRRGVLLITRDSVVSAHQVQQIKHFEAHEDVPFAILVYAEAARASGGPAATAPGAPDAA
ncbi:MULTISPECIES: HD domain-containing phosphohydrolase [Ralstonia]|uniref:HD domain-containing phosphohydrolase n=1 Tax=Ralstonia TaxID=48736 RepID=UPI0005EB2611|nr:MULTISPECIES: HD domain-containing phosphohydrolase [Ralstonia]MBU9577221.1 response regulator [Ralstonia mannitolilytica]PLT17639.1 HD domain-containing protein [Ralstonia mannitolilytica]QIF10262.1 response regulator [Ralstonia mannitolilytica]CAJ0734667.1 Regulator of RpoS [Ralstonia mannitolilytica]CAJ0788490.1 Regulator of RpoS [Ralstonia mannitolilytica]